MIVAAFITGLTFGFTGTIFNLPASLVKGEIPAVVGASAAFLIVRRKSAAERQN